MRYFRVVSIGVLMHLKQLSRSPLDLLLDLSTPLLYATLAIYLFRAGDTPISLIAAAIGAGLMGVWSIVLGHCGSALQTQRWQGTLEHLVITPAPRLAVYAPITIAAAIIGLYSMLATLLWARLLFGIPIRIESPIWFVAAVAVLTLALAMIGLLMASTFILIRNANAFVNMLAFPVWLLSGMLIPVTALPHWAELLSRVLPTTAGTRAVQVAARGGDVLVPLLVCAALGLACLVLSSFTIWRVERLARVHAKLALA